jgi:hypothetical protein
MTAGPSRLRDHPSATPLHGTQNVVVGPPPSQNVASLLRPHATESRRAHVWSTGSLDIDELLASPQYSAVEHSNGVTNRNTSEATTSRNQHVNGRDRTHAPGKGKRGVRPGDIIEIASPPGGGKTAMSIQVALNARMEEDTDVEVLLVGKSSQRISARVTG